MVTLVTGAPGWLGTRLVEVLCYGWDGRKRGRRIRCLVLPGVDCSSLRKFPVEIVEGDVRNVSSVKRAMKDVETVFHAIGLIHPRRIRELFAINTQGTKNIIEAAIEAKTRRCIYISSNSSCGFNANKDQLFQETDRPTPYMSYGLSKLQAEQIVQQCHKDGKIETVIIRPCWYYGPNQPERQTRFFKMIQSGKPIIFGNGQNLRSMSYIDNVIHGLLLAEKSEKANGQTYWISDERPYTVLEIYYTIAELLNIKDFKPRFVPDITSEICATLDKILQSCGLYSSNMHVAGEMNKNIACSIEKAKTELGYRPQVGLREGMQRSLAWCRSQGLLR